MVTQNSINLSAAGVVTYNGTGTFTGSTFSQYSMLIGGASNAIVGVGPLTDGQIMVGSTGVSPVATSLSAGTGITITPGAGSITIAATGSPGSFPYTVLTAGQALVANSGYYINGATQLALTLPTVSAVGDVIVIDGINTANGWQLTYTTGQSILFGPATSTVTSGSLTSTAPSDCMYITCYVANTTWIVESSQGNITVA